MSSIDIVLPVTGECRWLRPALHSIAGQSRLPECVTIVNDDLQEPENIVDFCTSLFGASYKIIKNHGRGISDALNTGVRESSCEWIARMDADDISCPDRLEKQIAFLESSSDQELAGCGTQAEFINESGKCLGYSRNPESWDEIRRNIVKKSCFVHPSLMIRRQHLLQVPYRKAFDGAEDFDLILRISETGKIINLGKVLLRYRMHYLQSSYDNRARQTALQELAIRLHYIRCSGRVDPVDRHPEFAEQFVHWRLSRNGYANTRIMLTMLRYLGVYLKGGDYSKVIPLLQNIRDLVKTSRISPDVVYRVIKHAGAAFVGEVSPFDQLNIG